MIVTYNCLQLKHKIGFDLPSFELPLVRSQVRIAVQLGLELGHCDVHGIHFRVFAAHACCRTKELIGRKNE